MSDVHAYVDALKVFEDATAFVAKVKARGWTFSWTEILGDIGDIRQLGADIQKVAGEVDEYVTEARNATVSDWQALGARAVADVITLMKVFTPTKKAA